jgi:hypothetical protein
MSLCCRGAVTYDPSKEQNKLPCNKPKAGLLNKSSCLAAALDDTKFTTAKHIHLSIDRSFYAKSMLIFLEEHILDTNAGKQLS